MSKQGYVKHRVIILKLPALRKPQYSEIPLNNVRRHMETKQPHWNEDQLVDLCMTQVFIESNFRTNSNLNQNKDKSPNHQTKNVRQSRDNCHEIVKTILCFQCK